MPQPLFDQQSPPPGAAPQGPPVDPAGGQGAPPQGAPPAGPPNLADQQTVPTPPTPPGQVMGPMGPSDPGIMPTGTPTGRMPGTPEFNEEEASPQEQAQYNQFVNKALDFMGQNPKEIVASMNNNQKPIYENVGELTVKLGRMVKGTAESAGVELSGEVLQAAGAEIIEHLFELGEAANIFKFDEEGGEYDQQMSMALLHATKVAGDELLGSPKYTEEMQDEAQNFYAQQVAGEVQRGEAPENFHETLGNQVAAGVRRATQGG